MRDGLSPGFNLKIADVVKEANRSTGAAYQIWKSQDDYRLELAIHVARNVSYADASTLAGVLERAVADAEDIMAVVHAVGRSYFEHLVSRPEFYLSLHFWATADNLPAEVRSAVEDSYHEIQSSFELFFELVLATFDVEIVAPHSLAELTTAATAVTEGMALRYQFTPTDDGRAGLVELYVNMLSALLDSMTRSAG